MKTLPAPQASLAILLLGALSLVTFSVEAAHNRADREKPLIQKYGRECIEFGGQYNVLQIPVVAADCWLAGCQLTQQEAINAGKDLAVKTVQLFSNCGLNPSKDQLHGGIMTFRIWQWHKDFGYNVFVPYIAVKKQSNNISPDNPSHAWEFQAQIATALHPTENNFAFATLPNGDLVAIKKSQTGSGKTEVHILDASDKYQSFKLQIATALHPTGNDFAFSALNNGDIMAIKKTGTGTGKTEVHILDASTNYQTFKLHTGTALHQTGNDFAFATLPNRDLMAIKKSGTGSGTTEVHILDASTNYGSFKLHAITALHPTGNNFEFGVLENGDLVAIKKSDTGTNSTEVHILDASSGYERFKLQSGTALHPTGDNFVFAVQPKGDVFAIKKSNTGSGKTEVHILY